MMLLLTPLTEPVGTIGTSIHQYLLTSILSIRNSGECNILWRAFLNPKSTLHDSTFALNAGRLSTYAMSTVILDPRQPEQCRPRALGLDLGSGGFPPPPQRAAAPALAAVLRQKRKHAPATPFGAARSRT